MVAGGLGGKSGVQALPPSLHAGTSLGSSATTAPPSLGWGQWAGKGLGPCVGSGEGN